MAHEVAYDAAIAACVRTEKKLFRVKRRATPGEVRLALKQLGYKNPETVSVERLCMDVCDNFYKVHPEIPVDQRNPNRDCTLCPVFGQACDFLGLITDQRIQDHYLWLHSGAMACVGSQIVCLIDIVNCIKEREQKKRSEAWVVIEDMCNDAYVHVNYDDAEEVSEEATFSMNRILSSVKQKLGSLLSSLAPTEG